jgi:hypothetical protein
MRWLLGTFVHSIATLENAVVYTNQQELELRVSRAHPQVRERGGMPCPLVFKGRGYSER